MFISVKEAAKQIGVSQTFLRQMIKGKRIGCYKLSARTTRVDLQELKNQMRLIARGEPEASGAGHE